MIATKCYDLEKYDEYCKYFNNSYFEDDTLEPDEMRRLALKKLSSQPSLNDAQKLIVRLCMAELDGKDGLSNIILTQEEMDILTTLLANSIISQGKESD